ALEPRRPDRALAEARREGEARLVSGGGLQTGPPPAAPPQQDPPPGRLRPLLATGGRLTRCASRAEEGAKGSSAQARTPKRSCTRPSPGATWASTGTGRGGRTRGRSRPRYRSGRSRLSA